MPELIEVVLVDIGNTQIKSSEARDGKLDESKTWGDFDALSNAYEPSIPFMACSTRSELPANDRVTVLKHTTPLPIKLDYDTPETLGTDRIAAAVGAFDIFPNTNTLVIDLANSDRIAVGGALRQHAREAHSSSPQLFCP